MLETWALMRDFGPAALYVHDPLEEPPSDLIAHILARYHEVHRREFPEAIRLARRVQSIYPGEPIGSPALGDHLALMFDELEAHQRREEQVLFPAMLNGGCAAVRIPLRRMMAEHKEVEAQLDQLRVLAGDYATPYGACPSWTRLTNLCRKLDRDLREHMRIENEELFPQFLN